jgi:hypothetical protein
MKPAFQRILPILKGVLVVCGILFLLQVVGVFFLKDATTNRFQEINNEVARSQQLGQLDTLSQQIQHSNNHVMGVLSEEGGKGPSPTRPDADEIEVARSQQLAQKLRQREINKEAREGRFQLELDPAVVLPIWLIFNATWMTVFYFRGDKFRRIVKEVLIFFGAVCLILSSVPTDYQPKREYQLWALMNSDLLSSQQKSDVKRATQPLLGVDKNFENSEEFFEQGLSLKYGDTSPASVRAFRDDLARVMGANFPRILYTTRANSKYELWGEIMYSNWDSISPQQKRDAQYAARALLRDDENFGISLEFFREGISLKYGDTPDPVDAFQKDLRTVMGANYPLIFLTLTDTMPTIFIVLGILVYIGFYFYKRNPDPHWTLRLIFVPLRGFLGVFGFYFMYIFSIMAAMCIGCDA